MAARHGLSAALRTMRSKEAPVMGSVGNTVSEKIPQGGEAVSPGYLLALVKLPACIGDGYLVDPVSTLEDFGRDLYFKLKAARP